MLCLLRFAPTPFILPAQATESNLTQGHDSASCTSALLPLAYPCQWCLHHALPCIHELHQASARPHSLHWQFTRCQFPSCYSSHISIFDFFPHETPFSKIKLPNTQLELFSIGKFACQQDFL